MLIQELSLYHLAIPLRFRFAQSNNPSSTISNSILLSLKSKEGLLGYGEACPRTYVTGESIADVQADLKEVQPLILATKIETLDQIAILLDQLTAMGIGPSARCALELALIDLLCKTQEQSLSSLFQLKETKPAIDYSLVFPLMKATQLAGLLQKLPPFSPPAIKIKVTNDLPNAMERIQVLRQHFGAIIPIRVDVNAGWTLEEALQQIPQYLAQGITSFEQALPANQSQAYERLIQHFGPEASIMADESLLTLIDAQQLINRQQANHFNLKISKLGGLLATQKVFAHAKKQAIPCQLGAHFGETSLLAAAGVLMACLLDKLSNCEGAMSGFLLADNLFSPSVQFDLHCQVNPTAILEQQGWSQSIDTKKLLQYSTPIEL